MALLLNYYLTVLFSVIHPFSLLISAGEDASLPIVVSTWGFLNANENAFTVLMGGNSALDAVEAGCNTCQREQCDGTVGYGGSPDENGETTLDAMIMDGKTMNVGAVAALRNVKNVISVARYVLNYTKHSFLVGSQATDFAIRMGFPKESLSTNKSKTIWKNWKKNKCQPNFWCNVKPDPQKKCGPYKPNLEESVPYEDRERSIMGSKNHDTIGMVAIDINRNIAVGTSTNGANHKIPGRVGDSPIIGSGGYAENGVGGAAATGDGDILMRFLPSFKAVESLKLGMSPNQSAELSLTNIIKYYPKFMGAIIVVDANGNFGAACYGIDKFPFKVSQKKKYFAQIIEIKCIDNELDLL